MAKKSLVILTSAVGVSAVVAGAYVARRRHTRAVAISNARQAPGVASTHRFANDWPARADQLTEDLAKIVDEQTAAVR